MHSSLVGLFCSLVGLFFSLVGLFCSLVGLFCSLDICIAPPYVPTASHPCIHALPFCFLCFCMGCYSLYKHLPPMTHTHTHTHTHFTNTNHLARTCTACLLLIKTTNQEIFGFYSTQWPRTPTAESASNKGETQRNLGNGESFAFSLTPGFSLYYSVKRDLLKC